MNTRRQQQVAAALFRQETELHEVAPVQHAALQCVRNAPGIDQRTPARSIGFGTSTIAGVIDRSEARRAPAAPVFRPAAALPMRS